MDWLGLLLIAYLVRGANRVASDCLAHPFDQPGYVRMGSIGRALLVAHLAMLLWWRRRPLGVIITDIVSSWAILAALYWLLGFLVKSVPFRFCVLAVVPAWSFLGALFRLIAIRR